MTAYNETADGQIHADFARRAGCILLQYDRLTQDLEPRERYEATLAISLLQALLTSFVELSRSKARKREFNELLNLPIEAAPPRLGLNPSAIDWSWRRKGGLTYRYVIEAIRNSLSHPTPQKFGQLFKTTGYTARATSEGDIDGYCFVQSPWVAKSGTGLAARFSPKESDERECQSMRDALTDWGQKHGVDLSVERRAGCLQPVLDGILFVPTVEVKLSTSELRTFTLAVADLITGDELAHSPRRLVRAG